MRGALAWFEPRGHSVARKHELGLAQGIDMFGRAQSNSKGLISGSKSLVEQQEIWVCIVFENRQLPTIYSYIYNFSTKHKQTTKIPQLVLVSLQN